MSSFLHSAFSNSPKYQCQAIFFSSPNSGQDKPSGEKGWREQASSANKHGGHLGAWPAARVHRPEAAVRPLVGRATYLGPYNVPRTSRPATNAGCGLLVVSFSPSGTGAREGPTFHQLGGLQLEARASWSGGPAAEAAQTECCSCSTAPVGLRESVGRRPPRRAHPPYSHGQDHPCKNLPACQHSLALPPAGRVVEPGGEGAACTVRGLHQPSGAAAQQTADCRACRLADRPQTPGRLARQRGAGLQSVPAYTDITMDSVQCLTSPHENPFHFRLHFCILGKLCQSRVQSGSHCGQ